MGFSAAAAVQMLFFLAALTSVSSFDDSASELSGNDVEYYQVVTVTPEVLVESLLSTDVVRCSRVTISGLSRLKLWSFSNAHRITLVPSEEIRETSYKKIQICSHKNSSLGLCHCENGNWENIQNGIWSSIVSPYEHSYIDVKFVNNLSGSVTVTVKSEFQKWRLLCLAIGTAILILAPIVSSWVPFYYSSSMAIGICLVVIILLFQGMKLLPTGRKSALYSTICGLAFGAGSYLLNRFSMFVNSILINFGISEEMHNPVLVFFLVGIALAGAAFGYWLVRRFVVSGDGKVDDGVAQFVKWALRVISVTFLFQSTLDTPLAIALLVSFLGIHLSLTYLNWHGTGQTIDFSYSGDGSYKLWSGKRMSKNRGAEFLSKPGSVATRGGSGSWRNPKKSPAYSNSPLKASAYMRSPWRNSPISPALSNSPLKGVVGTPPPSRQRTPTPENYYSTFHRTPNRKRFSKKEWKQFTEESTQQGVADLAASPEFSDWIIKNADRIQLRREDSSDESIGSGSDSTDENGAAQSSSGKALLWQLRK
ncbi:uncharacterized protein LOC127259455 [Andrographis paniculata]|uniref:uncharacterized protein LOC127259455 n=1 Tax=Andrographis paniculata TaxID=175694 RepID=UPI0021E7784B|nr:uncharacterized protein LOC127259455 [Andrographis paniculata]